MKTSQVIAVLIIFFAVVCWVQPPFRIIPKNRPAVQPSQQFEPAENIQARAEGQAVIIYAKAHATVIKTQQAYIPALTIVVVGANATLLVLLWTWVIITRKKIDLIR